jgi:hypothetical protein
MIKSVYSVYRDMFLYKCLVENYIIPLFFNKYLLDSR